MSRINDASLTQIGGVVQLYKYERFSQFIKVSSPYANTSLSFTTSSPQLFSFLSNIDTSTIAFSSTAGPTTSYSGLSLIIQAISNSSVVQTNTYTVNIGAGRFTNPPSNYPYEFYKNEPIDCNANTRFISSIPNISKPISTSSLPAGVGFVYNDICSYYLTGTPLVTYPSSNYNIIASDASSRTINTFVNIRVNPERVVLDNSGASSITGAAIDTQITPLYVIGSCPPYPYNGNNIAYTWSPSLPDGLRFTNSAGDTLTNGAVPITDSSSTIILQGAITSAGIKTLSSSNLNITLTGTRISQPVISNTANMSVTFEESVVFDVPTISNVYKDASFTYTSNYNTFRAYTLFADASITSMTASSLPTGVYLDFSSNAQRGYLVGTPSTAGTYSSTITATNANAKTRNLPVTIVVSNDSITFTTFPSSSTFIVGRSLSNAKQGYYSSPLTFVASSGSGCNVTMSITGISGTGLTFSGTPGSTATYTLTGRPTTVTPLTTAVVTANIAATSKTTTSNFVYDIVRDVFTFGADPALQLIQNVAMTPVDISASTLSGLPIIQYTSTNIPNGLTFSANGRIFGTPTISDTSGTFNVFATTGYTSDTCTYTFSLTRDAILLFAPQSSYTYDAGANVNIQITGLAYSGGTISNYQFANLPDSGLTIGSASGLITGPLTDSVPPNPVLPAGSTPFDICAGVGFNFGSLPGTFTTINPISKRTYVFISPDKDTGPATVGFTKDVSDLSTLWYSNKTTLDGVTGFRLDGAFVSDFKIKNTTVDSNVFMGTYDSPGGGVFRSTNGVDFSTVSVDPYIDSNIVSSIVNKPGTSTWFVTGVDASLGPITSNVYLKRSDDDGLTWSLVSQVNFGKPVQPRSFALTSTTNAYITAGTTLGYKDGVLLVGGASQSSPLNRSLLYSLDDGNSWLGPTNVLTREIARFNLDTSRWIATGSSLNNSGQARVGDATTIMFSDNSGATWTAATNDFNVIAYDIAYGNGIWVATGVSYYTVVDPEPISTYYEEIRVSSNGSNWIKVSSFPTQLRSFPSISSYDTTYPLQIGKPFYVSNAWNIVVQENVSTGAGTYEYYPALCTHADTAFGAANDLSANWTKQKIDFIDSSFNMTYVPTLTGYNEPQYVRTGNPTQARIDFTTAVGGPIFTSPTQTSFLFYQYMPITPITFSAIGSGNVYFFLQTEDLPVGLVWDPYTATITGKSVELGKASFTVYAKDASGVSSIFVQTETIIPRVIRQQTSAGAYTYLLKQYTEVLGAQASRDKKALPDEDSALGKFMAPPAPDVMSASNTCGCPTK